MDASAQTGSHELTIPNDVSHEDCASSLIVFFLSFLVRVICFPPPAHRLHHWSPGCKDQRDPPDVGRSDQDCQPRGRLHWQTGHHHWLPRQHQSGWVPDQCPVRWKQWWLISPDHLWVFLALYPLLSVTVDFVPLRLSSEATGLAANWRRGSSSAPNVTTTATQHPHFLSRGPLLNLMQKQSTRNSPFSPRLCLWNLLGHHHGIGILFIYWF